MLWILLRGPHLILNIYFNEFAVLVKLLILKFITVVLTSWESVSTVLITMKCEVEFFTLGEISGSAHPE